LGVDIFVFWSSSVCFFFYWVWVPFGGGGGGIWGAFPFIPGGGGEAVFQNLK